jgi:hypothetical protein
MKCYAGHKEDEIGGTRNTRVGDEKFTQNFGRNHLEDLGVGRRLLLGWILTGWEVWTGFMRLRTGTSDRLL